MGIRLDVRPMSINAAYSIRKGRKLKTKEYRTYETKVLVLLTTKKIKIDLPDKGELYLFLKIGVSSRFDLDNAIKPFLDILQKKFNFNDNRVTKISLEKEIVSRGSEYIEFFISPRWVNGKPKEEFVARQTK